MGGPLGDHQTLKTGSQADLLVDIQTTSSNTGGPLGDQTPNFDTD